jgi:hypothetical protein
LGSCQKGGLSMEEWKEYRLKEVGMITSGKTEIKG